MGFHNTCNIWQTLLATLFMPRMGHHPLSGGGKAARQPGGKRERKGKKRKEKTREIRSVTSPRFENSRCAIPSVGYRGSIRNEPGRKIPR